MAGGLGMKVRRSGPIFVLMVLTALVMPKANSAGSMEEVVFTNDDVALSGTIHLPAGAAKAGIVLIHGSAKKDSFRMTALAGLLADQGFAVFTYDKRGVGKSGGTFQVGDDEHAFTVLAEDAVAAFKTFVKHPRVGSVRAGLLGISQGGWVGPLAASRLPSAAFMVLWSGPVCTVNEEMHFSAFAKQIPDFSMQRDRMKIRKHMESVPIRESDFDPRPVLARLSLPVLWIFGGRDNSIPVELSIARLREMIRQGHRNFEFRLFPEQGHGLDYPTPYPNGYEPMITWINDAVK
jgi:uncharacterized protein